MSNFYLGQIRIYAFNFAPSTGALCNGQLLSISQNAALFSLIGTYYGGDGQTTFGLPNLQSRAPIGMGQGTGLSSYQIGQLAGTETVTLLTTNLPSHNHTFTGSLNALTNNATNQAPAAASQLASGIDASGHDTPQIYVPSGTAGTTVALAGVTGTTAFTGGGTPITNIQPYLALNFCINLSGIYPSRN